MGQQQILLIVLGIIVVSLAIYLGVILFRTNAIETKRNNVINESINLAAMAQQYYLKPSSIGGGNKSFTGWQIPGSLQTTANGQYSATVFADSIIINGLGNEAVTSFDFVEINISVSGNSYQVHVVH